MLTIRIYVSVLILTFLFSTLLTKGMVILEGIVIVCALLYMILEMRAELRDLRLLETHVSSPSR